MRNRSDKAISKRRDIECKAWAYGCSESSTASNGGLQSSRQKYRERAGEAELWTERVRD